jgi:hypothetical protein
VSGGMKARAYGKPFILLADLDHLEIRISQHGLEHALRGGSVRERNNESYSRLLDRGNYPRSVQNVCHGFDFGHFAWFFQKSRQCVRDILRDNLCSDFYIQYKENP